MTPWRAEDKVVNMKTVCSGSGTFTHTYIYYGIAEITGGEREKMNCDVM